MAFNRDSTLDISLGITGTWAGGVSDGTTLWFVDTGTGNQAVALRGGYASARFSQGYRPWLWNLARRGF